MGSIEEPPKAVSATIPVVDFSKWNTSGSAQDRLTVAKSLVDACRTVGFVYIINHGVSEELLDRAFATSKQLFDMSDDEKSQAPHPPGYAVHRGYSYPGLEKVSQDDRGELSQDQRDQLVTHWKETYDIGSENDKIQANQWLPEPSFPGFRDFATHFYWECHKVSQQLLRALALGIGLDDETHLTKCHSGDYNQLRLQHYLPIEADRLDGKSLTRLPAHTDWSSFTMLFQDDCGGLEVEDPNTPGKFVPADPIKNACVVNIGDKLMMWSNDSLKSTMHRVQPPPLADRYTGATRITRQRFSIPYFVCPDPDTLIECLPSCADADHPVKYEPITARDYDLSRSATSYASNPEPVAT